MILGNEGEKMINKVKNWFEGSIRRVILIAFILLSVIPIILITFLFTRQSTNALTLQMEQNLQLLAEAKAEEINLRLDEVMNNTIIAARLAEESLQTPIEQTAVSTELARYQRDSRNILGLDHYYNEQGGEGVLGTNLSNVFWTEPLDPNSKVAQDIIKTEQLDDVFTGIKTVSPDTQWVYMTTPEGMMRLFPWASNDHYPNAWDPREIVFYTIAAPEGNPNLEPRWTLPYVDFAGAGWMVTASVPMTDEKGEFLGVMSHDVTIGSLKEIALSINVLDGVGFGFLIDGNGNVIAHPAFPQQADATKGTQDESNLLSWGTLSYQNLIKRMVQGETGLGYYDEANGDSLLVFSAIPETEWSLGISIPRQDVIASAVAMRNRAIGIMSGLIVIAIVLAFLLTQLIHDPIVKLIAGVMQVTKDQKADEIQMETFMEFRQLATAFNTMAAQVWERESNLKRKVAALRIEIDTRKQKNRVDAIVETDFFKRLESSVSELKADLKNVTATD